MLSLVKTVCNVVHCNDNRTAALTFLKFVQHTLNKF